MDLVVVWTLMGVALGFVLARIFALSSARQPVAEASSAPSEPAGQRWRLIRSDIGPWPDTKPPFYVTVLDVKDGWVRYRIGNLFSDERLPMERFKNLYEPE